MTSEGGATAAATAGGTGRELAVALRLRAAMWGGSAEGLQQYGDEEAGTLHAQANLDRRCRRLQQPGMHRLHAGSISPEIVHALFAGACLATDGLASLRQPAQTGGLLALAPGGGHITRRLGQQEVEGEVLPDLQVG